jgi:hypothetical protein
MTADQFTPPPEDDTELEPDGFHDWMLWLREQNLEDAEENDE